jgi:YD repeat-containing protein
MLLIGLAACADDPAPGGPGTGDPPAADAPSPYRGCACDQETDFAVDGVIDGLTHVTYTADGQISTSEWDDLVGEGDSLTTWTYDADGRIVQYESAYDDGSLVLTSVYTWVDDRVAGILTTGTSATYPWVDRYSYVYDADGFLDRAEDDYGDDGVLDRIEYYRYGPDDRVSLREVDEDADGEIDASVGYTWGDDELEASLNTASDGTLTAWAYTYDANGDQVSQTRDDGDDGSVEWESRTTWVDRREAVVSYDDLLADAFDSEVTWTWDCP